MWHDLPLSIFQRRSVVDKKAEQIIRHAKRKKRDGTGKTLEETVSRLAAGDARYLPGSFD